MKVPNPPTPPSPPPHPARARTRTRAAGLAVLVLALLALITVAVLRSRAPLLPIPTPANLGELDPQVRAHLASLARRIAETPRDPDLRADLGLAFAVNGLWNEARQSFLDAVQLDAPGPLPAAYAAIALQELGDDAGAAREMHQVALRFPAAAPVWHRLGRALVATGDPAGATNAFAAVTRLAPDAWHGWAGLGEAQLRAGQPDAAVASLERARQLDPSARSVRQLLAQAYRAAGHPELADAQADAGSAPNLTPMPDDWSARALDHMKLLADQFERADTLLALGQPGEAVRRLQETLRFHPTNAAVLHGLARALNAAGQSEAASQLLASALDRRPDEVLLLIAAAETAAAREQPDAAAALALARRALALAPNSAEARVAEANALLAAGQDEPAVAALRAATLLAPRNPDLAAQLGDLEWHNLNLPDAARATYEKALRLDPLHTGLLFRLADLDLLQGRPADAARHLAALRNLRADPESLRALETRLRTPGPPP